MATHAPITGARRRASNNIRPIRAGIPIPAQRDEDMDCIQRAKLAASFERRAYELAQTEPNSVDHRTFLHMAGVADELPRNNLRLIVTPIGPRKEWFSEAVRRVAVARAAHELVDSRRLLALHLDMRDGGSRHASFYADVSRTQSDLNRAIEDALRTPTTTKYAAQRKQALIGRRSWATKYRPAWQAMVDEDLARYPARPRRKVGEA